MNFRFLQLSFTDEAWLNAYLGTFIILQPGASLKAVEDKMNRIYQSAHRAAQQPSFRPADKPTACKNFRRAPEPFAGGEKQYGKRHP